MATARAIVRLTSACDNACVMCGQAGGVEEAIVLEPGSLGSLRERFDELTFVGGEPSGDARLPDLVAEARSLGFAAIGLQTNARALAGDERLFARLCAAGLSDLQLSIHAASSAAHDHHTGRPGSFDAAIELLERARRRGLTCVVASVVTRSSFRELGKLPALLKRQGVAAWLIEWVRPFGRAGESFARVVPRFGMALPWALAALDQARRVDLPAWIRGAPACTLGPFASRALLPELPASFPATCEGCSARERCPGVDARYLAHFGESELDARRGSATPDRGALDPASQRLARMFVGVGEQIEPLAEHSERAPAEPPREPPREDGKHRRLPLLAPGGGPKAESEP